MTKNKSDGRCFDCNELKNFNLENYINLTKNISSKFGNFSDKIKSRFSCIKLINLKDKNNSDSLSNFHKNINESFKTQNSNTANLIRDLYSICVSRKRLFCTPIKNLIDVAKIENETIKYFKFTDVEIESIATSFITYSNKYGDFSNTLIKEYDKISSTNCTITDATTNGTANATTNETTNGTANATTNETANATTNGTANETTNATTNGTANATTNGTANATANGTANGTANATTNGTANATTNTTINGTTNETTNSTTNGTANDTANGTTNVTTNSTTNGTANGTTNGTNNGTTRNLKIKRFLQKEKEINKSNLFDFDKILCNDSLPAECNEIISSKKYGTSWKQNCGLWVINNILGNRCKISFKRTINLCEIVRISNDDFYKKNPKLNRFRNLQILSSDDIINSKQDPTFNNKTDDSKSISDASIVGDSKPDSTNNTRPLVIPNLPNSHAQYFEIGIFFGLILLML